MTARNAEATVPWLPPAVPVDIPGRGAVVVRHHRHPDATAPVLVLLHGWAGTGDAHFFTSYPALAALASLVVVDHQEHGRGLRAPGTFDLARCADDVAAVLRALETGPVVAVGYSMGGPIAMLLRRRHPGAVSSLVLVATALEWSGTRRERALWRLGRVASPIMQSLASPRSIRRAVRRWLDGDPQWRPCTRWLGDELCTTDMSQMPVVGRALARHDARPWVDEVAGPCAVVVTRRDRMVPPRKQRALAGALGATVIDVDAGHLGAWRVPDRFSAALATAVAVVRDGVSRAPASPAG